MLFGLKVWIRARVRALESAISWMRYGVAQLHGQAAQAKTAAEASKLRRDADELAQDAEDLHESLDQSKSDPPRMIWQKDDPTNGD